MERDWINFRECECPGHICIAKRDTSIIRPSNKTANTILLLKPPPVILQN